MGDAVSASRNVQVGGTLGAGLATAVLGSIASSGGMVLGIAASSLVPIVGPALAAATMLIQSLVANSGCGQTCIVTSQWANQAAAALQQVMDSYFALPAPRTVAQKAVAVAGFQTIWNTLQQQCGQPGTGDAGVRCISDRQAGACTWRQKYAPTYPGQPNIGECWNWFNGYLAPIQADPVINDPATQLSQDLSSIGSSPSLLPLALLAGLVMVGVSL
jgi:hypothetical protein